MKLGLDFRELFPLPPLCSVVFFGFILIKLAYLSDKITISRVPSTGR
jgi:hypothetical protein